MPGFPLARFGERTKPSERKFRNYNHFVISVLLVVIYRKLSSVPHYTFRYEKRRPVNDHCKLATGIFSIHNMSSKQKEI